MTYDLAAIVRKHYDLFNAHDPNKLGQDLAENGSITIVPFGMVLKGKSGWVEFGKMWYSAFPDVNIVVNNLITSGDWVVTEFEVSGTHKGLLRTPFAEIPATNKKGKIFGMEVFRFVDGKLQDTRLYIDALGMFLQLGILPEKFVPARTPEVSAVV